MIDTLNIMEYTWVKRKEKSKMERQEAVDYLKMLKEDLDRTLDDEAFSYSLKYLKDTYGDLTEIIGEVYSDYSKK